jgi:hypothetical protein
VERNNKNLKFGFLAKKLKVHSSFFKSQSPKKWRLVLFASCFALIGVIIALISFADTISTPTDPNAVVLQYSLPHILMPVSSTTLEKPMYQPFTLYGNGLLVCGHNSSMDFMPQHDMDMKNRTTSVNLPTATTLNPDEIHSLVQKIIGTGFLNLQPEYFKTPLGGRQYTIRLSLSSGDHFVMYYGDVAMPEAYSKALTILQDSCSSVASTYESATVKVRSLKDADPKGSTVVPIESINPVASSVVKDSVSRADSAKARAKESPIPAPIASAPNSANPAQADQNIKGKDAKALIDQLKGKNSGYFRDKNTTYEVAADPQLPQPSNPLKIDYKTLRAKKPKGVGAMFNSLPLVGKAHAQTPTNLPVRIVVLLGSDGGSTAVLGKAQNYGQMVHDWYCGQIGKCYNYQGAVVIRGSQTVAKYMSCSDPAGCPLGPLETIDDNAMRFDNGTVYRSDVDTVIVPGWITNSLAWNNCGVGYTGYNMASVDLIPDDWIPSSGISGCQEGQALAHEQGHTFGLNHTGNGTLMDGSPYATYAAYCNIGSSYQPSCVLDAGQKIILQGSDKAYIFVAPYAASTGPSTPLYRYWSPGSLDHFYDITRADSTLASYGWTNYEGCEANVYTTQQIGTVPLWRYWNAINKDHFYTTTRNDAGYVADGYYLESIEAYVLPPAANHCNYTAAPFWRYWNGIGKDHFYTITRNDDVYKYYGYYLEKCEARMYIQQGPGMVPLWRYFNGSATDHFYTITRNDGGAAFLGYGFDNQEGWIYPPSMPTMGRPLYSYYSGSKTDHLLTVDRNDSYWAGQDYKYEYIVGYVPSC